MNQPNTPPRKKLPNLVSARHQSQGRTKTGKVPDVEALKASKAALVKEEKKLKDANTTLNTKDEKVLMRSEEGGTG
jgi:hypothetical protein